MTKFSIIIPVYNVENYLKRCLDSVLNQTCQDFEIILINDGSTDNSKKICNDYQKKYKDKIKFITKKNGGLSNTRNTGLKYATGEYILFIDSDDYISHTMLDEIRIYENKHDIIGFQHKQLNDITDNRHHLNILDGFNSTGQDFLNEVCDTNQLFMMVWKYVYRRQFLKDNNLKFHENIIHEDQEWTVKTLCLAKTFTFIDKELYFYEDKRTGSIMDTRNIKSEISHVLVANELNDFIHSYNIESVLKKKLKHRIFDMYYYHGLNIISEEVVFEHKKVLNNFTNIKEFCKRWYFLQLVNGGEIVRKRKNYYDTLQPIKKGIFYEI